MLYKVFVTSRFTASLLSYMYSNVCFPQIYISPRTIFKNLSHLNRSFLQFQKEYDALKSDLCIFKNDFTSKLLLKCCNLKSNTGCLKTNEKQNMNKSSW